MSKNRELAKKLKNNIELCKLAYNRGLIEADKAWLFKREPETFDDWVKELTTGVSKTERAFSKFVLNKTRYLKKHTKN